MAFIQAQIDYQINSQRERGMSRVMDMACVALPCLLLPPDDPQASPRTWYGLTAWLLCSLRLLAGRRLCQKHVVNARTALHSRRRTLGRAINPEQATTPAAGRRNCFFKPTGSTHR
jgi:hypothetical protein